MPTTTFGYQILLQGYEPTRTYNRGKAKKTALALAQQHRRTCWVYDLRDGSIVAEYTVESRAI